jgi:copper chaperone CopZ
MTCAFAVRGALKKFQGVESVDVSLNKGLATVKLKPGNGIRPEQFWEAVHRNGFTPKDTNVTVRGSVYAVSGKTQLNVAVTNEVFDIVAPPAIAAELNRNNGKTVTVEGLLKPPKDGKGTVPLEIRAITSKDK